MKIEIKTIRQIIKEELRKVLKEELYTSRAKEEEAIQYHMETFGLSREEAKKAIDDASKEMMDFKTFRDFVKKDNKTLKAFKTFKDLSSSYRRFDDDHPAKEFLMKDFENSKLDFEEDFLIKRADQIISQNNPDDADLILGYNACMNDVDEELAKLLDIEAEYEDEMEKNMFFRDLGVLWKRAKAEPEIEQKLKNREKQCKTKLTYAYYAKLGIKKAEQDAKDDLEFEKRRQEWEDSKLDWMTPEERQYYEMEKWFSEN